MKSTKVFKSGESIESIASWAKVEADRVTGDSGESELAANVRVTIEPTVDRSLAWRPVLEELKLGIASDAVEKFIEYRRDDLQKPIRNVAALSRLLTPFRDKPRELTDAILESIRNSWTGIFERGPKNGSPRDRTFKSEDSKNGLW